MVPHAQVGVPERSACDRLGDHECQKKFVLVPGARMAAGVFGLERTAPPGPNRNREGNVP